uniref:Putative beta-hexosaminidase n=1 Tax=Pinctada maxima TaxID=104660 RepID=HEX_PINMA|nr:RecName: Full=Putative beta-hexosaminidase; AltName: Full=Beta-N-acetylhexosaminidase; AltName: Full=Chitobiase; AltName: Full=N-acetyl-beta-glucosaminidase; Flags: Precursor [Pinctada maxima]
MKWVKSGVGILGILLIICHAVTSQRRILDITDNLKITFKTISNFGPRAQSIQNVTIENVGIKDIPDFGWRCYFCHDQLLFPGTFNLARSQYFLRPILDNYVVLSDGFLLEFIKGCMYRITPIPRNAPIKTRDKREFTLLAEQFSVSKYDSFPNWYCETISGGNTEVANIRSTENLKYVEDFDSSYNWFRIPHDFRSVPLQPQDRYSANHKASSVEECKYKVIPTPVKASVRKVQRNFGTTVYYGTTDTSIRGKLFKVAEKLALKHKLGLVEMTPGQPVNNGISLVVTGNYIERNIPSPDEAYRLSVSADLISIEAPALPGLINGIETMHSLSAWDMALPYGGVKDFPRFPFRGIFLDIASNFPGYNYMMKFLTVMAQYKLNKLVLPLYNNEGFRLELNDSPGYEFQALHLVGGNRCHDLKEENCLFSQLGSFAGNSDGYLTKGDMVDLIKTADLLNIEIIMSLNIGESARGAIVPLKTSKHNRLLYDPEDTDFVDRFYPQKDSSMNPCREETMIFYDHMLKQLKAIYKAASVPLKTIMIGSKVNFDQVLNSKYCYPKNLNSTQRLMERENLERNINGFKLNFTKRLVKTAHDNGINEVMAIDDVFTTEFDAAGNTPNTVYDTVDSETNKTRFNATVTAVHSRYDTVRDERLWKRGDRFAELGYKVIISPPILDFNYAVEPDPDRPGDYDSVIRNISFSKLFRFVPDSHCCNIPNAIQHDCALESDCTTAGPPDSYIGTLGKLDTRKLRSLKDWNELLFPRLLIFAERSWHKSSWEDSFEPHRVRMNNITRQIITNYTVPNWNDIIQEESKVLGCISRKEKLRLMHEDGLKPYVEPPGARLLGGNTMRIAASTTEDSFWVQASVNGNPWTDNVKVLDVNPTDSVRLRTVHPAKAELRSKEVKLNLTSLPTPREQFRKIAQDALSRRIGIDIQRARMPPMPVNPTYRPPVPLPSFDPADDRAPDLAAIAAAHPPPLPPGMPPHMMPNMPFPPRPPFVPPLLPPGQMRALGQQAGQALRGQGQQTGQQTLPAQPRGPMGLTGQAAGTGVAGQSGQQPSAAGQGTQQGLPGQQRTGVVPGQWPFFPGMPAAQFPPMFNPQMQRALQMRGQGQIPQTQGAVAGAGQSRVPQQQAG